MSVLEFISLGIALGTDSFSVSVGIGLNPLRWTTIVKLALLFSLTQVILFTGGGQIHAIMDWLLAWAANWSGTGLNSTLTADLVSVLATVFSLIGAAVIAGMGINMLWELSAPVLDDNSGILFRLAGVAGLGFSVSIDALTADWRGMLTHINYWMGALILSLVIGGMALVGLLLGRQIHRWIGSGAEIVGGVLLIALAIHFFLACGLLA